MDIGNFMNFICKRALLCILGDWLFVGLWFEGIKVARLEISGLNLIGTLPLGVLGLRADDDVLQEIEENIKEQGESIL